MAKGFSFEEALQPTVKGFSFEEALLPEPTLSPEEQVASQVGQGTGETVKDLGKLTAAGAVRGTLGAPEAIQSGFGATARETAFAPTDVLNLIADPRMLANKLAGSVGIPPVFEEKKFVPAEVTAKQKAAVDEVLTKGKIPQLKTLTEYGNKLSEDIENTVSPEMKLALAESQPTGNILKALETGDFSEVSFGKNPTLLGLSGQAAKVFGSAAPAFLTAVVTKKAGPAAAVGFGQAGAEGVDEARTYIGKMSDDELTKKSEYFRNLVALGYSPKEAREMTVNKAGDTAALYQGTVGALGGVFTSKLLNGAFDKTLLASAKSRLGKIAQGTALGATEGGLSEMAEGVATDLGIDKAVVREIGVDSFANLVLGALGEGAPGTVRGAIAPTESKASFTFEQAVAPEPTPVTPAVAPPPEAVAPVAPPAAAPTPIGQGEFETPEVPTAITPPAEEVKPKKTTFEKKPNDPVMEAEAIKIADEIEKLGNPNFAAGFRGAISNGGFTNDNQLNFYRQKLLEEQQKAGTAGEKVQETFNIDNYLPTSNKAEIKRFKEFLPNAPEDVKATFEKSNQYLQQLTDKINALGYKVLDVDPRAPSEVRDLKALISGIAGSTFSFAKNAEHISKDNRFANPNKLAKISKTLEQDFAEADRLLGVEAAKPKATEVVQEPIKVERELPKRSSAKDIPVLTKDEVLDSTDPENIKKVNEILKDYEVESGQSIEGNFLDAIDRNIKSKEEEIKAPPISKSSVIPTAEIRVAPYDGGFLASSSYTGKGNGYSSPISVFGKTYPTRQEAIDAEANRIRKYAQEDKNTVALKWLDSVSKPTKEGQVAINKARQAEKKAKVEKPVEVVKPKIEDIVSPEVAASMKDIEFQNRLIKANNEKTITKTQFSRLFKLYQDGKTPQANDQLTKMLAQNEKKAKKEEPEEEHIEGKKSEPITTASIEKAVTKSGETVDYAKMKKAAENQIDQAIKRTKFTTQKAYNDAKISEADRFVSIKLEGNGSFKVMNNKERLEEFKKKLANVIKPKQAGTPRREWQSAAAGFKAESAFKNFLDEKEPDTAVAIANLTGLDISKVVLNPAQRKILDRFIQEQKDTGGEEPMMETIKSKPGANVARIAKLLGPQLYGSMSDISTVSVKEMLQNSFDAIKTMIEKKETDFGKIDIVVDKDQRTIAMTDDGSGMSPDTLANVFLTIAGTKKDTEFGSGGFGIAKMLFLFGNEEVEVTTMKDGKISSMYAKGGQLMAALEDPSQAPDINVQTKEEMPDWEKMFPKGHGTFVRVTVPKEFKDQSTGEMKEVNFPDNQYAFEVLENSPLFANIEVTFNGNTVYGMGSNFNPNEYTTFVDAKFDWGTARIYVSNAQISKYGENMRILSNGLWQFGAKLKINPMDMYSDNIPYRFYLDIVSKVKPDEEGYPFQLNRQGFTKEAESDLKLIKNYLVLHYRLKDYNSTVQNFGTVQYLSKSGKDIIKSDQESLVPETEEVEQKETIKEGSKVEVKDGKLIVNGKEVPLLTPEDLKKASIDVDALRIPQDKIDPNKVMIHDNLEISTDTLASEIKEVNKLLEDNYNKRYALREKIASEENTDKIDALKNELKELEKDQDRSISRKENLARQKTEEKFTPITKLARDKFGDRFDKFMFDIGDAFMALRDAVSSNMPADKRGIDYKDLAKEAIGVSFDKEYRGVSIVLPFKGLFINPAFPEYIDTPEEAALGMFGTMIHELAHHKVRNHGADFPAEMQRILIKLESSSFFDVQQLKKDFILTVKENKDIIDFLNKEGSNESNRPIGQRFKDSEQQARGEGTPEDVSKRGAEQRGESRISGESGQRAAAAGEKQQPKSVSSKDKAASKVDELLEKHERSNTPLHPSGKVKDTILGSYQATKRISEKMAENPLMAVNNMTGKLDRAITYARNKNVWYGSGLDQADFAKYNGQLRNSQGLAVASVAVTNAIHAGHVATQVMVQGKLIFDPKTQMFRAEKDSKSLANVVTLKHDLEEKLGKQRAANVVNAYFEAKRSRSIVNEYLNRSADYEAAIEAGEDEAEAAKNLKSIEIAIQKVNMDDEAIAAFIALEKDYPELEQMMENWTAVNNNMLDMMEFAGVISKKRAEHLRNIEDYVPWYRIMDDQTDVHLPAGVRGMTNVGQEKKFKAGTTDRDIDDIVDNMIHNVMMMTRNSMKNYANNRIAMEYATRNEKGKIRLYPTEGSDANGVRVNLMANGRRVIVNIPDPLIAEASLGMENIEIPMVDILAFFAQGLRRGITTNPAFQVSQLFMDAATSAWVSGVKRPDKVWAGTFGSFIRALQPNDPIVEKIKSYGFGGYQSSARTPEKELKLEIGLLNKSVYAKGMKTLDHIGDASDYAQRRAVYKQVLAETGDEMQALIQANNVIDFIKRGSGKGAQFVTRTVSFMNAYAQSIDVLATALAGGGLKGKSRKDAQKQMLKTGLLLAGTTILYCMAVGADDEYNKLDDQTKIRNIIIPGTGIRLPMHTSASFFFKSIPELIYNKVMKEGTKNQMDNTRLRKALSEAAIDSLVGPNMIPTGVKPVAEIALNHNFFTGGNLTPKGMEKLESFRQYNSSTSELGKVLSGLTMGALNPIEADHLVRSLFGTAGAAVMYGSNLFNGDRVTPQAKDNPIYGSFILPEVPRGREDLFYDLKERSDKKYETFVDMMKKQHPKEAKEYREENKGLIAAHGFVTGADAELKRINAEIRRLSDLPSEKMSSDEKRARITRFQEQKNRILEKTIQFRLKAEL